MKPNSRSKARELALALLFQDHFQEEPPLEETFELLQEEAVSPSLKEKALELRKKVKERERDLEEIIEEYSKWRKERIDLVDRAILKLALYEMLYDPTIPPAVAIDEAIELAKKYSSSKAYKFINGLLDRVKKERLEKSHGTT
ncbi:MAG: transcription antitermination factor NusB [Aquificota bacterium]|nr:MAG: transcription antitermination factor NusB [Aquificota bacterium]